VLPDQEEELKVVDCPLRIFGLVPLLAASYSLVIRRL
jgi:hypothetical protein